MSPPGLFASRRQDGTRLHWERQLESILGEDVRQAQQRESTAFDVAAGPNAASIVIYGGGNLGRKILQGLREHGTEPLAFADANPELWDSKIDGVRVLSPQSAVDRFGKSAAFVVCIWHPAREGGVQSVIEELRQRGAERVISFPVLFWKYPDTWLPYYFWDLPSNIIADKAAIHQAAALFRIDGSRDAFLRHVQARMFGDFSVLPAPNQEPSYFPRDLFTLLPDECFIDCGAYDGDTIREFLRQTQGRFRRIIAFEPDPRSAEALRVATRREDLRDRTVIHPCVLGTKAGKVRFDASGSLVSAVCNEGGIEVECAALDDCVRSEAPTFIKMDIEGSETAALRGAEQTIRENRPVLAVCVYHRPDDLWRIPLLMSELEPGCEMALRMYWMDGFDNVCYAIPRSRLIAPLSEPAAD